MPPNIDRMKSRGNIRGLIRALSYEKIFFGSIGEKAAAALGEIGDERAILPLLKANKITRKTYITYSALKKIIERGDKKKVVRLLIKSLKRDLSRGLIEGHNRTAIEFLGKIGDASAVKTLIAVLQAKPWRQTSSARQEAALALGEIGDEQAVEPLLATLSVEDKYVAGTSAEGIHHYGDFEMKVHRAAEKALEKIGAPSITPMVNAFKKALPGSYARIALTITISSIHDPRAVKLLTSILQDEDLKSDKITEDLHRAARDALKGIDTPGAKAALKTFNLA